MQLLITTIGGSIAAVCFRRQSQLNYEFAMDRPIHSELHNALTRYHDALTQAVTGMFEFEFSTGTHLAEIRCRYYKL